VPRAVDGHDRPHPRRRKTGATSVAAHPPPGGGKAEFPEAREGGSQKEEQEQDEDHVDQRRQCDPAPPGRSCLRVMDQFQPGFESVFEAASVVRAPAVNASSATLAITRSASVRLSSQLSASVVGMAMANPPAVVRSATQMPPASAEGSTDCPASCRPGTPRSCPARCRTAPAAARSGRCCQAGESPFDPRHAAFGLGGQPGLVTRVREARAISSTGARWFRLDREHRFASGSAAIEGGDCVRIAPWRPTPALRRSQILYMIRLSARMDSARRIRTTGPPRPSSAFRFSPMPLPRSSTSVRFVSDQQRRSGRRRRTRRHR
jgi:hypothetical protein